MNIPQIALERLLSDEPVPPKSCGTCQMSRHVVANVWQCKMLDREVFFAECTDSDWRTQARQTVEEMRSMLEVHEQADRADEYA